MPRHINVGIRSDEELNKIVSLMGTTISEGGQMPNIHEAIRKHGKGKKRAQMLMDASQAV